MRSLSTPVTLFIFAALLSLGCVSSFAPTSSARSSQRVAAVSVSPSPFHKEFHSKGSTSLASYGNDDEPEVQVNEIDNIDATTITAVGFGLIAFNFLVLANMGDGGIGGIIATIMNTFG